MLVCASCGRETPEGFARCANCGSLLEAGPVAREVRKTVTVLFCDLEASTALGERTDPEALRAVLARYFERMKGILERHGGSVEKFIGDAVMAVFGVPTVHEDDALRACRAAVEMRAALPGLGVSGRIGVSTGEVVAGTEERLATGDVVNVASRLEQAAQPGEVLIGAATLALVRGAVEVETVTPLELKGKAEPVPAFRLLGVTGELERRFTTPMVGRERELRSLRDALTRAVADRSCQLFTVLGSAGVGKSRLAAEFLSSVEARVVRGHCLSYGEGITYWPVVNVLKQLDTLPEDAAAAAPLRSLLGEVDQVASAEEIAWGFRKLLEQEAQTAPLICVLDDLQWAEPTFLSLVESVAELSRDAPILLLCMARPDLLELRPSWAGGTWNATTVLLEPLDAAETEQLLAGLGGVDAELAARVSVAADGNPLFVEEMVALVRHSAHGRVEVPPTIQALLATRLDQLDASERAVLERASVEGQVFHRGAVEALGDGEPQGERLTRLMRKDLVRPDRSQVPGEDAYRFRHLLLRDAAYDALPKTVRADLHRRFADWLETHGRSYVELEEILGYHLEQATQSLADLGQRDPVLSAEAATQLATAGRRALARADVRAANSLLRRAVALSEHPDVHLLVDLAGTMDNPREGSELLDRAADAAERDRDAESAAYARAMAAYHRGWAEAGGADEQERLALTALPLLEAAEDHAALAHLWSSLASGVYNFRCQFAQMEHASEQHRRHALLAGQQWFGGDFAVALIYGPRPTAEALSTVDARVSENADPGSRLGRAILLAMSDRIEEARIAVREVKDHLRELGNEMTSQWAVAEIEHLAGNDAAAADHLRLFCDDLRGHGNSSLSSYAPLLGRELCALGRFDEAEQLAAEGRKLGDSEDPIGQALWRQTTALVQAQRGNHADAERLAREAVGYTRQIDSPWALADALTDLGEVLEAAGRREDALTALHEALELYERKGIIPLARRTNERLDALRTARG